MLCLHICPRFDLTYLALLFMVAVATSCGKSDINPDDSATSEPTLIFNSGFEPDTEGLPVDAHEIIQGKDLSYTTKNDWVADLNEHPKIGNFSIQYQGGDVTKRYARIIDDPTNPGNKVLYYWLDQANVLENGVPKKGRIQANIYDNTGIAKLYHSSQLYLHPDFNYLLTATPAFSWLTLFEYWNNPNWLGDPHPFRITVNLAKVAEGPVNSLYFLVHGQKYENNKWVNVWEEVNTTVPVPIGEWNNIEIYFSEGNATTGKFKLEITPVNGISTNVFDITNFTHHPDDPEPDGLSHFNPMKIYTSAALIDSMRSKGKTLQAYWDDFVLMVNE